MSLLMSCRRCHCGPSGCYSYYNGCPLPASDLTYSWVARPPYHAAGSTTLHYLDHSGFKGWYGVVTESLPLVTTFDSPTVPVAPPTLTGDVGACAPDCPMGGSVDLLIVLECTVEFGATRGVYYMAARTGGGCLLDPGSLVVPATGRPRMTARYDWSSCSGVSPSVETGIPADFGSSSETCAPLSLMFRFQKVFPVAIPGGGGAGTTYAVAFNGVITL